MGPQSSTHGQCTGFLQEASSIPGSNRSGTWIRTRSACDGQARSHTRREVYGNTLAVFPSKNRAKRFRDNKQTKTTLQILGTWGTDMEVNWLNGGGLETSKTCLSFAFPYCLFKGQKENMETCNLLLLWAPDAQNKGTTLSKILALVPKSVPLQSIVTLAPTCQGRRVGR